MSFGGWTFFGTGNKALAKDLKPKDYYLSYSHTLSRSPCRSASRRVTVGTPYRQLLLAWLAVIILSALLATASDYSLSYLPYMTPSSRRPPMIILQRPLQSLFMSRKAFLSLHADTSGQRVYLTLTQGIHSGFARFRKGSRRFRHVSQPFRGGFAARFTRFADVSHVSRTLRAATHAYTALTQPWFARFAAVSHRFTALRSLTQPYAQPYAAF